MSVSGLEFTGSGSEMEGDVQRPAQTEEQKEKRRAQNRESQRRWRQRNRSNRARSGQQPGTMRNKTQEPEDVTFDSQSTIRAIPGSSGSMHRTSSASDHSMLERLVNEPSNVRDFQLYMDDPAQQAGSHNMQRNTSRYTAQVATHLTSPFQSNEASLDQYQAAVNADSIASAAIQPYGLQVPHTEANLQVPLRHEQSGTRLDQIASVYSPHVQDDLSTSTNSPMTSASMSLHDSLVPNFPGTAFNYTNPFASLGGQLSPHQGHIQSHSNFAVDVLGPNDMLDLIQRVYQSGVNAGYWVPDVNILNWLELTRGNVQNAGYFQ